MPELSLKYELWHTQVSAVISQIILERLSDFKAAYKFKKRREINPDTYTISDYLIGLSINRAGIPTFIQYGRRLSVKTCHSKIYFDIG